VRTLVVILALSFSIGGFAYYRYTGPEFEFFNPTAIHLHEPQLEGHRIGFPQLVYGELFEQHRVPPRWAPNNVLAVDMNHSSVSVDDNTVRIDDVIGASEDVKQTIFLTLDAKPKRLDGLVRFRVVSPKRANAHRQNGKEGEWFWLREFYEVALVQ